MCTSNLLFQGVFRLWRDKLQTGVNGSQIEDGYMDQGRRHSKKRVLMGDTYGRQLVFLCKS